jgi:hypothetical protein
MICPDLFGADRLVTDFRRCYEWHEKQITLTLGVGDSTTTEHFAATINQLKGKVTMMFITHAMPKNLQVDEIVRIGSGTLSAVSDTQDATKQGVGA